MLLHYSLHEPRRGHEDIKAFMAEFREAFPDLNFWGTADLIAEGDYVVARWEGGGKRTGPAFGGVDANRQSFMTRICNPCNGNAEVGATIRSRIQRTRFRVSLSPAFLKGAERKG